MKIHNDFTLYFRVVPSGKRVVYYYAYDEGGRRLTGKSTGETTLTAARLKCNRLLKAGELVPKSGGYIPTFAEYAIDWWDWEKCDYLKKRRKRSNLTQNYADFSKRILDKILLPYFGKMRMDTITQEVVEAFVDSLIQQQYKNTTINGYFSTLKTMLIEAEEQKVIAKNPIQRLGKLRNNRKEIEIITQEEFKKLFVGDWMKVWENDWIAYTFNKLAALSGMRSSEILGLKGCYVYDEHIFLCMQHDEYGYRPTKTKDKRNIPLPASMITDLNELKKINGDGYLFSANGGGRPVCRLTVYRKFHHALVNIGISMKQIADRKLHLHAWRHFFNTELLKGGLTITQTQAITGHKSERMTEMYAHFEPGDFKKAKEVQDALLRPNAIPETENTGQNGVVIPFPA
jgi:integrase